MKNIYLYVMLLFCAITSFAQSLNSNSCDNEIKEALRYIYGTKIIVQDVNKGFSNLKSLADSGCMNANYQLGKIYYKSSYNYALSDRSRLLAIYDVFSNTSDAFKYVDAAAKSGHLEAKVLLAQLYKRGYGCKLNYEKALALFEEAHELGDRSAAFHVGYCYYKGLGSVSQNYTKAIEWFNKTDYPMAKHFLAVCNYFGHGLTINRDKAIELLLDNQNVNNSVTLLKHLEESNDSGTEGILSNFKGSSVEKETKEVNDVLLVGTEESTIEIAKEIKTFPSVEDLKGSWSGKLVDLDYSGERIMRSFPVEITIDKDSDTGGVACKLNINQQTTEGVGILLDNSLYFSDYHISLPVLYKDHPKINEHEYSLLSADLELKEINYADYLVAYVETKNNALNEPAAPKLLILSNNRITTNNGIEISEDVIKALLEEQGESFIKLYPNPFISDLLIQYQLTEDALTSVDIFSLNGIYQKKIVDNEFQSKGDKLYHIDGNFLSPGTYIIKIIANGIEHTKIIIKN